MRSWLVGSILPSTKFCTVSANDWSSYAKLANRSISRSMKCCIGIVNCKFSQLIVRVRALKPMGIPLDTPRTERSCFLKKVKVLTGPSHPATFIHIRPSQACFDQHIDPHVKREVAVIRPTQRLSRLQATGDTSSGHIRCDIASAPCTCGGVHDTRGHARYTTAWMAHS